MKMRQPAAILTALRQAGFEAWYVGGCVRDTLLGRPVHDWDITTSALPQQVLALFGHCVPTGLRHGTVTVLEDGTTAEVTTYRTDGAYLDGRHPSQVTFVGSLAEDLARRDFTVNAMAMDDAGTVVDLYGGQADLAAGLLRAVGEPSRRFGEDALRMLRALRFSAQLGFSIEAETSQAIDRCAPLASKLSAERVRDEVEKALLSPRPQAVGEMAARGLLQAFGLTVNRSLSSLAALPPEAAVRWTALCRVYPELELSTLRLPGRLARDAMAAARINRPADRVGWKQVLAQAGLEQGRLAAAVLGETAAVEEILQSGECLSLRQLAVTGADFPQLHGPALGIHLQGLLAHVLIHPEDNRREVLLTLVPPNAAGSF